MNGQPVECPRGILAVLHKPVGYTCSHDPSEGPLIYDLLPHQWLKRRPAITSIGRCADMALCCIAASITFRRECNLVILSVLERAVWHRLDKDTSGLLLVTTLTQYVHKLTSPNYHIPKRYVVSLDPAVSLDQQAAMVRVLYCCELPDITCKEQRSLFRPCRSQPSSLVSWCFVESPKHAGQRS